MSVSKFITLNGLRLHYLDHGTEGKAPLVCIHGLTSNAHAFDSLAPDLRSDFHVRSVDVRGRGDSGWTPGAEYTPQNYATDLAGLLDELKIDRVTLIGTSMGGMISILFAGGYPNRVEKVILNDIGPDIDPAGIARIGSYVGEAPNEFNNLQEVAAYYRENYPAMRSIPDAQLIEQVKWSVKPADDGKLTWKMDPQIRKPMRTASRPMDMWVPFARIEVPVLVIRGADSDILAARTVERMKTVIRNVESVEVPGVGHAPALTEPESLTAIRKFLAIG
ncbi:MAG TPA: alpha/beta hydrolase [Candidatus Binataceae bacterium]|nr:alpha/beta hydrolase [Candidatus Binataceae bacterium]